MHQRDILCRIQERVGIRLFFHLGTGIESERDFTLSTFFGIDDQYTIGTLGTPHGRSLSIFQYLDRLDVGRGYIEQLGIIIGRSRSKIEIVIDTYRERNAIDNDQRIDVTVERLRTTNTNGTVGTGVGSGNDVDIGKGSLQGLSHRGNRSGFETLHAHTLHGTEFFTGGKTHLVSLHPFSRNADFVEFVAIFGKGCIQDLLSGIFYGIALHTDKREINYEILLVGYFDTVLAVGIDKHAGQSTFIFVLHKNAGSGKRFA